MLERLSLRDLALIDRAEIEFGPGLNVITGETGSGKSLLVQAVDLLIGERADAEFVRDGARSATVQGEFRVAPNVARAVTQLLETWGIEFDGETVIVRREIAAGGKSRAIVNQSAVTLSALKQLGELLADLHGQHEHQSLLRADAGLETLDRLASLHDVRARYVAALAAHRTAAAELERLEASLRTYHDERDEMEETARDIDLAQLTPGEDVRLRDEAARLAHADRLRERATLALAKLSEDDAAATHTLNAAAHALEQAATIDPALARILVPLDEARIATGEAARALTEYLARLDVDPATVDAIESRREQIARLTRKYRRGIDELLAWRAELAASLALGESGDDALAAARAAAGASRAECITVGRALSRARHAAGRHWSTRLTLELEPLGFQHATLAFEVESDTGPTPEFLAHGLDRVEIQFTANRGEPAKPLRRIASGGEISRVMLALKSALQAQDRVDVLIFDEVDSGIGGAVAQAVGERLVDLSRHRQILCVTHLPIIAAFATHHLRVVKHVSLKRTVARIEPLEGDDRIEEIARMLAGSRTTETTRRQAKELLVGGRA